MPLISFPLFGTDAAWWKMNDATNRVIITALLRFEGRLERDKIIATFAKGIAPYLPFRARMVSKGWGWTIPFWEEVPNFNVEAHIHAYATTEPVSFESLEAIVGELMSQPLPEDRPQWQAYLIEEDTGGTAMVFRVHHALGDGAALVHFLLSLTEQDGEAPIHTRRPHRAPWYEPLRFALATVLTPFALLLMPRESNNPFRGSLGTVKHVAWSRPIPLDTIKTIGKATDSTVNDVLIAAVAGALRPFLVPLAIQEARAAIPIALRAFGDTPELGNQIGLVFLDLPVGLSEPLARLTQVKARMNALKRSPEAIITFAVLWLAGYLPDFLSKALAWFLGTKITAVMTNVPGPQVPLRLTGVAISQIMFWVPQAGNCGLGVSLLSYNGTVTIGITTDATLLPKPEQLTSNFEEELQKFARFVN
jgi:diacylglycerol O-acyltransferase